MKELGYGHDYKYAHSYDGNFVLQEFLPESLSGTILYTPQNNPREKEAEAKLKTQWKGKYKY
jgi:putative ATPase